MLRTNPREARTWLPADGIRTHAIAPDGATVTGLADRAGLSRRKVKEAIVLLVERVIASGLQGPRGAQ